VVGLAAGERIVAFARSGKPRRRRSGGKNEGLLTTLVVRIFAGIATVFKAPIG